MDRQQLEARNISNEVLGRLRQEFQGDVRSVRRIERITSVRDLLETLERQDLLDERAMQSISNIVAPERQIEQRLPAEMAEENAEINYIHELIASRIGRHWKEFARTLGVNENEIDSYDFDAALRKDPYMITLRVLTRFRQNKFHNPLEWLSRLRKALEIARRNDIWEIVDDRVIHLGGLERLRW